MKFNSKKLKILSFVVSLCLFTWLVPLNAVAEDNVKYAYLASEQFLTGEADLTTATDIVLAKDITLSELESAEYILSVIVYCTDSEPADVTFSFTQAPLVIASNVNLTVGEYDVGQVGFGAFATENAKIISNGNTLYCQPDANVPLVGDSNEAVFCVSDGGKVVMNNGNEISDLSADFSAENIIDIINNMYDISYDISVYGDVSFNLSSGTFNFDSIKNMNVDGTLTMLYSCDFNCAITISDSGKIITNVGTGINGVLNNNGVIEGKSGSSIVFSTDSLYSGNKNFYTSTGTATVSDSNIAGNSFTWDNTNKKWLCTNSSVEGDAIPTSFSAFYNNNDCLLSYKMNNESEIDISEGTDVSFASGDSITFIIKLKSGRELTKAVLNEATEILPSEMLFLGNGVYTFTLTNLSNSFTFGVECDVIPENYLWNAQSVNSVENVSLILSESDCYVEVLDSNGQKVETESALVGTGYLIKKYLISDNKLVNTYCFILSGDINGSGLVDETDVNSIISICVGNTNLEPTGCYYTAADINNDGVIDGFDAAKADLKIKKGY